MTPYLFVCAGCGLIWISERSDALTCSVACRVRAHRNGYLKSLRADAKREGVPVGGIGQMEAIMRLCPHLEAPLAAGKKEIGDIDVRAEVWEAFCKLTGLKS